MTAGPYSRSVLPSALDDSVTRPFHRSEYRHGLGAGSPADGYTEPKWQCEPAPAVYSYISSGRVAAIVTALVVTLVLALLACGIMAMRQPKSLVSKVPKEVVAHDLSEGAHGHGSTRL